MTMKRFKTKTWFGAAFLLLALAMMLAHPAAAQQGTIPGKVEQLWFMQGKISGGVSVSNSSAPTALPASGFAAWVCNTGSNDAYLSFGPTNAVTAAVGTSSWLKAGGCATYDLFPASGIAAPFKFVAAITATSTTALTVETGMGSGPSQVSSGGGGGGSVTQGTVPWVVAGPTADGSPATTPPVLVAGTLDGTGTGTIGVMQVNAQGAVTIADSSPGDTTGSFTGTGAGTVTATNIDGYASAKIQVKGTYAGFTVNTNVSSDSGTTFVPITCALADGSQIGSSFTLTANQSTEIACGHLSGDDSLQLQTSVGPATGTANVDISPATLPSMDGSAVVAKIAAGMVTTTTMQSAVVANGNGTTLAVTGLSSAALTVICTTCSGGTTVNFEGTQDGTNYSALNAVQMGTSTLAQSTAAAGVGIWQMQIAGLTSVRARVSGYSAGTVTVTGQASPAVFPDKVTNLSSNSPGVTPYGQAVMAGSLPVVVASDQTGIPIKGVAGAVPVPFALNTQYPINSVTTSPTPVTASATGTSAATAATLAATASVTNFVCGFTITADATALATGTATLSGTVNGSLSYLQTITAITNGTSILTQTFSPCIPASAAATAITITSAPAGTGGNTIANIWGYRL
jgi:hypothetical protein